MRNPYRFLFLLAPNFAMRRRVVNLWLWSDTDPLALAVRNFLFWVRHPRLFLQVRRGYFPL